MRRTANTRITFAALTLSAFAGSLGCNALDEKQESPIGKSVKIIPTDTRAVTQPEVAPPPITGGTMLTFGEDIAIADPARDRVTLMKIGGGETREVPLAAGAQPFRMTRTPDGDLYVVLRGSGEVARINMATASLVSSSTVCAAPRGIDFDVQHDELVVACAEGKLVNLTPGTLELKSEVVLEPDLRDVVIRGNRRFVSRFRSAEVLFVDDGMIVKRVQPGEVRQQTHDGSGQVRTLRPAVAWRMVSDPLGGVMLSHQRAVIDSIGVDPHTETTTNGDDLVKEPFGSNAQASPYGGSGGHFSCDGIVQSSVTAVDLDGETTSSFALLGSVLPVDLAISPDGREILVANGGAVDEDAPSARVEFVSEPRAADVFSSSAAPRAISGFDGDGSTLLFGRGSLHPQVELTKNLEMGCEFASRVGGAGPSTSVAFTAGSDMLIQERGAALLHEVNSDTFESLQHALGGAEVRHTGHEIFHRDSGGGLACASCHPEGGDDGNVWTFTGFGPRRTQNLALPLKDTAPFHWDGSLKNLSTLMDEVFVERMGGVFQSKERLASLEDWMFSSVAPEMPKGDEQTVARGEQLFHSPSVGCGACHSGSGFTDNNSYNVGTTSDGQRLQVPPLNGLLLRPPYMHNGCAKTLHERFGEECGGGDAHGQTSQLSQAEIDDLVAYLETL